MNMFFWLVPVAIVVVGALLTVRLAVEARRHAVTKEVPFDAVVLVGGAVVSITSAVTWAVAGLVLEALR